MYLKCFFFVSEEGVQRRSERDHVDYATWVRQGHINDYDLIRRTINELSEQCQLKIAIYRWNATQIATQLTATASR